MTDKYIATQKPIAQTFPWYQDLGRLGPACDDTDSYQCTVCKALLHTRQDPPNQCPQCGSKSYQVHNYKVPIEFGE